MLARIALGDHERAVKEMKEQPHKIPNLKGAFAFAGYVVIAISKSETGVQLNLSPSADGREYSADIVRETT